MAVNKVVMNTENGAETLIDLTVDTVTAETLAEGVTAHDASGTQITGTMTAGTGSGSANAVLYTAQTLTDEQKTQARTNIGAISENDMYAYYDESMMTLGSGIAGTLPGVLKWNGIIGNRAYVDLGGGYCVHVTDEVPTIMAELPNATIGATQFAEGFFSIGMPMPITQLTEDGAYACGEAVFIIPYDNYVMDGIAFPKKGVYFMAMSGIASGIDISEMYVSSLLIPGYAFAESGGSSSGGGSPLTVTWDGSSKDVTSSSGTYVKVSDVLPTEADLNKGYSFSMSGGETISASMCVVTPMFEGILGIIYTVDMGEGTFSIPLAVAVQPSAIGTDVEGETFYEAGLYFADMQAMLLGGPYIASLTINGMSGSTNQTDWNQTDSTAPDFLKNKPFGMVYGDTLTLPTYSFEELDAIIKSGEVVTVTVDDMTCAKVSDSAPTMADLSNGMTITTASGESVNVSPEDIEEVEGAPGLLYISDFGIYCVPKSIVGVDIGGGFAFPESGMYIAVVMYLVGPSLIVPGYTGFLVEKKLERKHLQHKSVIYLRLGSGSLSKSFAEDIPVYKADILSVLDEGFVIKAMVGATEAATMTPITVSYTKNYAEIEVLLGGDPMVLRTAEYAASTT